MFWFVIFSILVVLGIGVSIFGFRKERKNVGWGGVIVALIGVALMPLTMVYSQDVGQSKVQVSFTGTLQGQTTSEGLHLKAPWVNVRTFDTRNNIVSYIGAQDATNTEYAGGPRTGPQITFQDREGVSGNMDVTVRYSLDPEAVTDIYTEYKTQEALISRVINEIVRSEAREATVTRNTIEVYNDRAALALDLREGLEERISVEGFIIDDVAIQEIRYSEEVRQRFDDAQAARIEIDRAEANQEAAKVDAETKVIEAQGVADANDILTQSLSPEILTQRYLDALNEGSVFVVPEGSTPLITTQQKPVTE